MNATAIKSLLITHSFPPAALPESYVLSKSLGNVKGYRFDVVCSEGSKRFATDPTLDPYVKSRFGEVTHVPLHWLTEKLPHSFNPLAQLPDLFVYSNSGLLKAAKRCGISDYSTLVTSSMWHSSHLVGLALKREHPHLNWVARFSDPWLDNPYLVINPLCLPTNRRQETQVFETADRIVFTSAHTLADVLKRVPKSLHSKFLYIPHCYDPELYTFSKTGAHSGENAGKYVIRHLGHFYGPRSPEPLLLAIESILSDQPGLLQDVCIELIGSIGRHKPLLAKYSRAAEVVRIREPVKYLESLGLAQDADCLLVIDAAAEHSVFLPSKLIDYLGTQRYIFAITPPGASAEVVSKAGGTVVDPEDRAVIQDALVDLLEKRPNRLPRPLPEFSADRISELWRTALSA